MKRFLIHIAAILSIMLLIMTVLDVIYTEVYRHAPPRTKLQYLRSLKNKKIDYLFLGSSRVENGINAMLIEKETGKSCVNLGIPASKMDDIYTVLQLLKSYNIKFEKVFIQVDYIFNLNGRSNILQYQFMPFLRDNETTKAHFDYLENHKALYYVPFYRYCTNDYRIGFREFLLNATGKKGKIVDTKGYVPKFSVFSGKSNVSLPSHIMQSNPAFDSIQLYCKTNNIPVVYFCAPFMRGTKNMEFITGLKQKIPGLKDYSQLIANDSLFKDGRHVNDRGATYLTQFMISDLKLK